MEPLETTTEGPDQQRQGMLTINNHTRRIISHQILRLEEEAEPSTHQRMSLPVYVSNSSRLIIMNDNGRMKMAAM